MKFHRTRISIRPVLFAALFLIFAHSPADAAEWALQKQADGIDIYTRPVEGSDIKEFKAEGMVDIHIDEIVALLQDSDRFQEWFPNTSDSRLIKRDGDISYQYSVMQTPWPISDRDNIFRSVTTRDTSTGSVHISIEAAPKEIPENDGLHRVTRATGSWQFTPEGADKTLVVFVMHLEPGGGLPDWLVNARIVATPYEALMNMRKILGVAASQ